jgi:hypothetical protein
MALQGDWFCPLCITEGRDKKRPPPLQIKPKPLGRSRTHQSTKASSNDGSDDGAASRPKKAEGCASPTGELPVADVFAATIAALQG